MKTLDVILDRQPDADAAAALWSAIEAGQGRGLIPAHGITTIFYLIEKARGAAFARRGVERLVSVFGVAPVNEGVVRRALALAWRDFEDAVCAAAAQSVRIAKSRPELRMAHQRQAWLTKHALSAAGLPMIAADAFASIDIA